MPPSQKKLNQRQYQFRPSAPAMAFANRVKQEEFEDVYVFACLIDTAFSNALEEAREEERARIFRMGFLETLREFWSGRKLREKQMAAEQTRALEAQFRDADNGSPYHS